MDTVCMRTQERTRDWPVQRVDAALMRRRRRINAVTGGGTGGNEMLTSMTGAVLILLLAVLGITILRIHQLIWLHLSSRGNRASHRNPQSRCAHGADGSRAAALERWVNAVSNWTANDAGSAVTDPTLCLRDFRGDGD